MEGNWLLLPASLLLLSLVLLVLLVCLLLLLLLPAECLAWPIECASKFMWPFLVVCVESAEANVVVGGAAATSQQYRAYSSNIRRVLPVSVENCKYKETGCQAD